MKKEVIVNDRYPHHVKITRRKEAVESDDPFERATGGEETIIIYEGKGRSYTDTTTNGTGSVDVNKRKASIPVRFDEWDGLVVSQQQTEQEGSEEESESETPLWPMDGDIIEVTKGNVTEAGKVRDFEPDNNRSVIYWELTRQ